MKKYLLPRKQEKCTQGFTLAELLIVIAIIGVLVAVSIPIFNAQMEKARRAVDMHTARSIESALTIAYNMGQVQIPQNGSEAGGQGVFVMICRDNAAKPEQYTLKNGQACFCAANANVLVNGKPAKAWNSYNEDVAEILKGSGLDPATLCTRSNGKGDGWDWIIIQVGLGKDKTVHSRIYSGAAGKPSGDTATGTTNIEKQIYGIK